MKKTLLVFLLISSMLLCCSCISFPKWKSTSDVKKYGEFFKTEKFYKIYTNFDLFPDTIPENSTVNQYLFSWRNVKALIKDTTDIIVFLDLTLTSDGYNAEVERISQEKDTHQPPYDILPIIDDVNFNYTAYSFSYVNNRWKIQYVLMIPEENRLIYVYLQYAEEEACDFPHEFLPIHYFEESTEETSN